MVLYKLMDVLAGDVREVSIPEKYHELLSKHIHCTLCDSPIMINENLTIMQCNNPNCSLKLTKSLVKVVRALGIKGIGEATIATQIREANERAHRFAELDEEAKQKYMEWLKDQPNPNAPQAITNRISYLKHPMITRQEVFRDALAERRTYSEAVQVMSIPTLHTRAIKVFEGCDSYADLVDKAKSAGGLSAYLYTALGVNQNSSILIKTLVHRILTYRKDLEEIPDVFNIRTSNLKPIMVMITGNITKVTEEDGRNPTKARYIMKLNDILEAKGCRLVLQQRVTQETQILVSDSQSTTNFFNAEAINADRIRSAQRTGTEPQLIIITTSNELIEGFSDPQS